MNHFARFILAVAVFCSIGRMASVQAASLNIVQPAGAGETELFAAQELQRYLKQITGENPPIIAQAPADAACLILDKPEGAEQALLGEEGYILRTRNDDLLLLGGGKRGTLYAVYDFLERLGCRWYYPDQADEVVPRKSTADVIRYMQSGIEVREVPDFSVRMYQFLIYDLGPEGTPFSDAVMGTMPGIVDWMAKNRMNIFQLAIDLHPVVFTHWPHFRKLVPEMRKRGIIPGMGGHCLFLFLSEDDFKKNPDWRPMVNGQRTHLGQFCTGNEDAVRHYIDNMIRFLKENPDIEYFAPWPNDAAGWCECPLCRDTSSDDRVMNLSNRVYTELKKAAPHVRYTHFAYQAHMAPPERERPLPGLTVTLCTHSRDLAVPFDDPRTKPEFRDTFAQWNKLCKEADCPFVFHGKYARHWGLFGWHPLPLPILETDSRWFREQGLAGFELPIAYIGRRTKSFNLHVLCKLMWQTTADVENICQDYFRQFYLDQAGTMRRAYGDVEKAQPTLQYWKTNILKEIHDHPAGQLYPDDVKAYVANAIVHLEQAEGYARQAHGQAVETVVRERIDRFERSLAYLLLEYRALNYMIAGAEYVVGLKEVADQQARSAMLEKAKEKFKAAKVLSKQRNQMAKACESTGCELYWDIVGGAPANIFRDRRIDEWLKLVAEKL